MPINLRETDKRAPAPVDDKDDGPLFPRTLSSIDELTDPGDACLYEPVETGGFRMKPDIARRMDEAEAEGAARADEEGAAKRAEADKLMTLIADSVTSNQIRNALIEADVPPKLVNPAVALLRDTLALDVEMVLLDDAVEPHVTVQGGSVEFAVTSWLASDQARGFQPVRKSVEGEFTMALRRLSGTH